MSKSIYKQISLIYCCGLLLFLFTFVFIYFQSAADDRAGSSKMSFVLINSSFIAEVFLNKSLPMLLFPETSARCYALLKVLVKCSWHLLCVCSCFTTWYNFQMLHWRSRSKNLPGGALNHPSCCSERKKNMLCCACQIVCTNHDDSSHSTGC